MDFSLRTSASSSPILRRSSGLWDPDAALRSILAAPSSRRTSSTVHRPAAPISMILATIAANLPASSVLAMSISFLYSADSSVMRSMMSYSRMRSARMTALSFPGASGSSRMRVTDAQPQAHITSIVLPPSASVWGMSLRPLRPAPDQQRRGQLSLTCLSCVLHQLLPPPPAAPAAPGRAEHRPRRRRRRPRRPLAAPSIALGAGASRAAVWGQARLGT